MTQIKSRQLEIHRSREQVYDFLVNFDNFEKLMPEQVTNWQSDGDSCSFEIKGMAKLSMVIKEKKPHEYILMEAGEDAPFPFTLSVFFLENNADTCDTSMEMHAKLNPMLQMMAKTPLENFINMLNDKLKEVAEKPDFSNNIN